MDSSSAHGNAGDGHVKKWKPIWEARLLRLLVFFAALGCAVPIHLAHADLGALVAKGEAGRYQISVLAAPSPLRVGKIALNISVQPNKEHPRLKADHVWLILDSPSNKHTEGKHAHHEPSIRIEARREKSTHPGMLGAVVELPSAGTWKVQTVIDHAENQDTFAFDLMVSPPPSPWVDYGFAFAFPVVGLLIFIWHQRRKLTGQHKG